MTNSWIRTFVFVLTCTVKQAVPTLSNNCLNPDQAQQCVRPDLGPNCLLNILFISRQHYRIKGRRGAMHMT